MREYINRLSRGKFRYDIPDIIQPDDVIIEDVICDATRVTEDKTGVSSGQLRQRGNDGAPQAL